MVVYPDSVNERVCNPRCAGVLDRANAKGKAVTFVCGTFVKIELRISTENGSIEDARFTTNGCGYMIAAADELVSELRGKCLRDFKGLSDNGCGLLKVSEQLPEGRRHCGELAIEALKAALADHREKLIGEFTGSEVLICTCFGVTENQIEQMITARNVLRAEEVGEALHAGTGCGSCRMLIQEIIDGYRGLSGLHSGW